MNNYKNIIAVSILFVFAAIAIVASLTISSPRYTEVEMESASYSAPYYHVDTNSNTFTTVTGRNKIVKEEFLYMVVYFSVPNSVTNVEQYIRDGHAPALEDYTLGTYNFVSCNLGYTETLNSCDKGDIESSFKAALLALYQ